MEGRRKGSDLILPEDGPKAWRGSTDATPKAISAGFIRCGYGVAPSQKPSASAILGQRESSARLGHLPGTDRGTCHLPDPLKHTPAAPSAPVPGGIAARARA